MFFRQASVPHPFRFFLRKGWETNEFQVYTISETALKAYFSQFSTGFPEARFRIGQGGELTLQW